MKQNFVIFSCFIFFMGCAYQEGTPNEYPENPPPTGDPSSGRQYDTSNPVFDSFKNSFSNEASYYSYPEVSDIPINFGDVENIEYNAKTENVHPTSVAYFEFMYFQFVEQVGVCIKYSSGAREILIKQSVWDNFSEELKEILIFHELGHCHIDREHKEDSYEGIDLSIMHPVLINQEDYIQYYREYQEELFLLDEQPLRDTIDSNK